jgi:hypothetical protein
MVGIVKTIDGVKKIVPLDKTLAPAMDIVPNNTIMKFSNATNSLVDTGIRAVSKCDGKVHALNFSGLCNKPIDISGGGNNNWGTYNWDCPDRDRLVLGSNNHMNGYGYKQIYGFANIACPMGDSTTILLGSANYQCVGAANGLAMAAGVFNYFYNSSGTTITYGLSNCSYGICSADLPAECAACAGISESTLIGINNKVYTAWSHVHGSGNTLGGWASINSTDPETHITTNVKSLGSSYVFGNSNTAHGAGVVVFGHTNTSCYALNSVMVGVDNHAYGCSEAGYKYNQFMLGINNCTCGYDTTAIGVSNHVYAPATTAVGNWNTICAGAAGGLAIGNGALVKNHRGFTRSLIRAGGAGEGPGKSVANMYTTQIWLVSGCGTLEDFYYAMQEFGTIDHLFMGDLKISLGATVANFDKMNKYSGATWSDQGSGDLWFTGGSFSFQPNVEWYLSGTNTHENYIMHNVYQYLHCPVEAHITLVSA